MRGRVARSEKLLFIRDAFVPQHFVPLKQILLQFVGESSGEVLALRIGDLAAFEDGQDLVLGDRIPDLLPELGDDGRQPHGNTCDPVGMRDNGPGDGNATRQSGSPSGRQVYVGRRDLILRQPDQSGLFLIRFRMSRSQFRGACGGSLELRDPRARRQAHSVAQRLRQSRHEGRNGDASGHRCNDKGQATDHALPFKWAGQSYFDMALGEKLSLSRAECDDDSFIGTSLSP